mmetsp:Transcript_55002/g.116896  ORF Transcript_55002/g.116896 Transcript_55002/m.116896 type:complete len:129 (-) Transcript_55002:32-418(-)
MATAKQYLLMKRQRALILEHVGGDESRMDAWRSRLRMLGRNIEVRRADVRRMKVKLESMGADDDDEGDSRRSSARGDDDKVADSRTALTGTSVDLRWWESSTGRRRCWMWSRRSASSPITPVISNEIT